MSHQAFFFQVGYSTHTREEKPVGIGDVTCRYNACSPLLRCAVKPNGPCRCEHYQPKEI
ncbi:DUF6464 family protein [Pleurocapsa sp. PCC 7327]|uniref:DUF6464 family protein n=1 Tax=Pleurocapsa sp. PCC 7327 TaxID=118163 RepID=UPI00211041C2|nr:DUF6464 family protein [Pleurocapsa sp. PCC 7327]